MVTNTQTVQTLPVIFPAITLCGRNLRIADIDFNNSFFQTSNLSPTDFEEMTDVESFILPPIRNTCIRFNGYMNDSVRLKTVIGTDFETNSLQIYFPDINGQEVVAFVAPNKLNSYAETSPIGLFPGKVNNFYVTQSVDIKLPEPYNRCLNESESYHKENCVEQCIQSQVSDKYNCTLTGYYYNKNLELCTDLFLKETADCQSQCVDGCFTLTYSVAVTEDAPAGDESLDLIVVFGELRYTEISQVPKMTVFDLIGSIGGTLGIFVGFQILSIIEIFQFVLEIFLVLIHK